MTRTGKIARLPRNIRDELNRRIDNGEPGVRLVEWLNSLPEIQQVLKTHFDGHEITEKNLSDWKANGYLEWQGQQQAMEVARELRAKAVELVTESNGDLTESLATIVAASYATALDGWSGEMTDEMRRKLRGLKGLSREVVRLCRNDQTLQRTKMQREWLALGAKASDLNHRRYEDSRHSAEFKAMQFCLGETMEYPEVQELFKQAFAALEKATAK